MQQSPDDRGPGPGPSDEGPPPCYVFSPKHRWHVKLNFMTGIALPGWLRFLRRHWRHIHWTTYGHRVLFLSFMAVVNFLLGIIDHIRFGAQIARQPLHPEPLIILGHPRTGTTHLHNLLSLDDRFAYVSTFAAGCPQFFITADPYKWLWSPLLERQRPMDAMSLSWTLPAEDEIATSVLCGGLSPYMSIVLPNEEAACFRGFYSFEGPGCAREAAAWRASFLWMMRKVTFFAARADAAARGGGARRPGPRPLLIKSPVHTARIGLLLKLFPGARFVYIHRDPYEVFQSAAHMADAYYWYTYLQTPTNEAITEFILHQYDTLWSEYQRQKHLVPPGRLVEVSFSQLEADPLVTLQRIYEHLGQRERFESVQPLMTSYCRTLSDFKKNQHCRLGPELKALVRRRWAESFEVLGYA